MKMQSLIDNQGDNRAIIRDPVTGIPAPSISGTDTVWQGVVNGSPITISLTSLQKRTTL
jgi:hypothetical protein